MRDAGMLGMQIRDPELCAQIVCLAVNEMAFPAVNLAEDGLVQRVLLLQAVHIV